VHSPAYSAEAANKGPVDKEGALKTISEFTQACDRKSPDFAKKHSFQLDLNKKKKKTKKTIALTLKLDSFEPASVNTNAHTI